VIPSRWLRGTSPLTDTSDHLSLDDVLLTEALCKDRPVPVLIRRPPDPVPHVSAGKDQDGHKTSSLPDGLGLYERHDVRRSKVETDDPADDGCRDDDVWNRVEGGEDGEGVRSQVGLPVVQLFETEPATEHVSRPGSAWSVIVAGTPEGNLRFTNLRLKS
jgi:hypothetical protein